MKPVYLSYLTLAPGNLEHSTISLVALAWQEPLLSSSSLALLHHPLPNLHLCPSCIASVKTRQTIWKMSWRCKPTFEHNSDVKKYRLDILENKNKTQSHTEKWQYFSFTFLVMLHIIYDNMFMGSKTNKQTNKQYNLKHKSSLLKELSSLMFIPIFIKKSSCIYLYM